MLTKTGLSLSALLACSGCIALASPACGSSNTSGFGDGTGMDGGSLDEAGNPIFGDSGGQKPACKGLQCQQVMCAGGATTSLTGTAYAPNGTLPLYNVIVYVPNAPLDPLVEGVTCDKCGSVASGSPVVTALSDSSGNFKITNVPAGDNIPLVLQVGKWRRQVVIPHVEACKETALTDPNMTRLPKKQSEGHLPHIAVTTGDFDAMGCLLPKMGVDNSEFGVAANEATKRVIFYQGQGPSMPGITSAQAFWSDAAQLKKFDVVMLSCEGDEFLNNKPAVPRASMEDYLTSGGRILGTDFMYTWERDAFDSVVDPSKHTVNTWFGGAPGDGTGTFDVDTSFPKGLALAQWLSKVGASTTMGKIDFPVAYSNFDKVNPLVSQRWVHAGANDKIFTYNLPVGAAPADQCGKSVFLDVHIADPHVPGNDVVNAAFPGKDFDPTKPETGCLPNLTPQEKAFIFFLMDLSSCIQPDNGMVNPPPVK